MKRDRVRRWLRALGSAILSGCAHMGASAYFLPSAKALEEWPADAGIWTYTEQLGRLDRRAWAEIEAALREASCRQEGRCGD